MKRAQFKRVHPIALAAIGLMSLGGTSRFAQAGGTASAAGPAHPRVSLSLADPSPVIGVTGETELRIEIADPPQSPMAMPRIVCSAGQVEDLVREGPNTFTARYILPASRFPQPAIVVAEFAHSPWPIRGMASIRLRAAATPTFRTNPGAQVTLRVGDRDFGPQTAPADGVVHVPVVVPPGVESAIARSVSQYGKATEQTIDLRVPYSQRLLFVAPQTLAAGSLVEFAVYAVEPSGRPANASAIMVLAEGTRVQPLGSRIPGEARFLVAAPAVLKTKTLRMEALLKGQTTTLISTKVALVPAAVTGLRLEPEGPRLAGPNASMRVFLGAADAFGNPVDASGASVLVDGRPTEIKRTDDGAPVVFVQGRVPDHAHDAVRVEAVLDNGHALARIPITTQQRSSRAEIDATARYALVPRLGLLWNLGKQTGAVLFVDAVAYHAARYPGFGLGLALGLLETWFAAESRSGISRTWLTTVPLLFQLRQQFLVDRAFFGFGAGAGMAFSFARIHSYGQTLFGRSHGPAADVGMEAGLFLKRGSLVLSLHYLLVQLATFSSGDRIVGNAAGATADVGYRLTW
jgi:hypothetical protein